MRSTRSSWERFWLWSCDGCTPRNGSPTGSSRLLADRATYEAILAGRPLAEILSRWDGEIADFHKVRSRYLLY